jgi:hypothetical protein
MIPLAHAGLPNLAVVAWIWQPRLVQGGGYLFRVPCLSLVLAIGFIINENKSVNVVLRKGVHTQ